MESSAVFERWSQSEAIYLPGILRPRLSEIRGEIARTRAMFARLRGGGSFAEEMWRRLAGLRRYADAGVSVDMFDPREIEKVHVDGKGGARDLWAKLSWVSADERDPSLRIRFSFGSERMDDWGTDVRRAVAADGLAEATFPEGRVLAGNRGIRRWLGHVLAVEYRLSERIVYANAPGGGAAFHHDAEPGQLGVVFGQLAGRTAWLALPKRRLARLLRDHDRGRHWATPAKAMRAMDDADATVHRLLNRTPTFTRRVIEAGACVVLRPGDALLLPSNGPDDVAWHSVFALGKTPSLGHSYGIYPAGSSA